SISGLGSPALSRSVRWRISLCVNRFHVTLAACIGLTASVGRAQDSTRAPALPLDTIIVRVTRGVGSSPLDAPFAMTILRPDSARPGQRQPALDRSLSRVHRLR